MAFKSVLQNLNHIQYQALGLCTGAIRTTQTATGNKLLNYWVNLQGHNQDNSTQVSKSLDNKIVCAFIVPEINVKSSL